MAAPAAAAGDVSTRSEIEEQEFLGHGANVTWAADAPQVVGPGGYAENATLVVHGADDGDLVASVRVRASIGPLHTDIVGETVEIPAGTDLAIPVRLDTALDLHERQFAYTTKLLGHVTAVHAATGERFVQLLDARYLAFDGAEGVFEVMDHETREQRYPYGFTTAEGQAMVRDLLAATPEGELVEAIGPGIAIAVDGAAR